MTRLYVYTALNRPNTYMTRKEPLPSGEFHVDEMGDTAVQGVEWYYVGEKKLENFDVTDEVREQIADELEENGTSIFFKEPKVA